MIIQKLETHSEVTQNLIIFVSFLPSLLIRKCKPEFKFFRLVSFIFMDKVSLLLRIQLCR